MTAKKILTQGIVQGVGFRPYVYRLATSLNLKGHVRNLGNVVEIILEGEKNYGFRKNWKIYSRTSQRKKDDTTRVSG